MLKTQSDPFKRNKFLSRMAIASLLCGAVAACSQAGGKRENAVADAQIDPNALAVDVNRGAAGLSRCLLELGTRASLLMVTAHPDDEDGGMLAYQSRYVGARALLLTLNRGEGGQNAMSPDFYDALGLVRTQELLQADRYYGVQQYWGTVIDYGFSKTREEALQQWGYERVLSDTVRVVRMTRPLIVTSVFIGAPTDGHGNHQVAGQMAQEVFDAAADPKRFPEQIREGLRPWKPLKIYERVPFFAATKNKQVYDYATDKYVPLRFFNYIDKTWIDHTPATNVTIPEGNQAAAVGLTFLQIARQGWGFQKSQNGGGTIPPATLYSAPYHRYASRIKAASSEKSFYDGIDISLNGIATLVTGGDTNSLKSGLAKLTELVRKADEQYRVDQPWLPAPILSDGLQLTRKLEAEVRDSGLSEPGKSDIAFELHQKTTQFEQALTLALGVSFNAAVVPDKDSGGPFASLRGGGPTFTIAIPGQHFSVQAHLLNSGPEGLTVDSIMLAASDGKSWVFSGEKTSAVQLAGDKDVRRKFGVTAPADATIVKPYFARPSQEQPYYDLTDARFRNLSLAPYPLIARASIRFHGSTWELQKVVQTNSHVNQVGTVQEPLLMAPALSVSVAGTAGAIPLDSTSFPFSCSLQSNVKGPAKGTLRLTLPAGWHSTPDAYPFDFSRDGDSDTFRFKIEPAGLEAKRYAIKAVAQYDGKKYSEGYHMVGYPGLRPYPYYRPALYEATGVNVKTAAALKVGFVPGTGDDVPQALENLGIQPAFLSGELLAGGQLNDYDAVILGVRAYSVRSDLRTVNARLLSYVKNGGVLIVQYNLQNLDDGYAPYSFSLGSNPQKVVDENSAVKFLVPLSPVLNWPNKITEADFKGWEEERGHGFMKSWAAEYQPLFETRDPGQDPQKGGLLVARYGKGFYIYDAFALYRQLPAGVPGAYRILANLVSLAKNPEIH